MIEGFLYGFGFTLGVALAVMGLGLIAAILND